jgi:transcriptional regulator with PAS, ATPase and Fis domain
MVRPPRINEHARERGLCQVIQDRDAGTRACETTAFETLRQLMAEVDRGTLEARPFTVRCHAGLHELVAPIAIDGMLLGALLCGGFFADDGGDRAAALANTDDRIATLALAPEMVHPARRAHPWLRPEEIDFVAQLLRSAAEEIALVHGESLQRSRGQSVLEQDFATRYSYDAIIGRSPPMQELYSLLDRVVQSESTVLIQGENGTGKELVARAIHYNSSRKSRRFVVTNCSAFNDNLLDSELFGHKRGAFTGAIADKHGLFEVSDKGTFFLDEIGDMTPSLQVKVLRVLQEGTFTPVGDTEMKKVDVRIIAATNRDLRAMVANGQFREDLYYRINVINLVIPSLRERLDDIELLIEHFQKKHSKARARSKRLSDGCLERMRHYAWPGNVRELENEIERLMVLSGDEKLIDESLLSSRIRQHVPVVDDEIQAGPRSLPDAVKALERRMIRESLERNNWNKTRASAELRISRRNLIRLVQKYQLDDDQPPA